MRRKTWKFQNVVIGNPIPLTPFKKGGKGRIPFFRKRKLDSGFENEAIKYSLLLFVFFVFSCATPKVDLIVYNAKIYLVDSSFTIAEAMAVKEGKVVATGTSSNVLDRYTAQEKIDAGGQFVYPGFIDAHAHFLGYGKALQTVDLTGTRSWEECVERIINFIAKDSITQKQFANAGTWITGRGWDQNDWDIKEFPNKEALDKLFTNNPVLFSRVDGHAAIVNQKALHLAGISTTTKVSGGEIEIKNGRLTGILIDNAIDLATTAIPAAGEEANKQALMAAEKNCFAVGLTTVDDCGLYANDVETIQRMQESGKLKMRLYVMLSDHPSNYEYIFKKGKIKTDRLTVRSFKLYADGALGSRGACLLEPYADRPNQSGFLLSSKEHFDSAANILFTKGFQMCTHAIGDSGNRIILNTYARYLKGKNDLRWRIEHAQVVNQHDIDLFGRYSIIPSVQPTHATSDMYWAGARLGNEREKGAYAFKDLMNQNGWLPLGTDFPVEDINPLKTFYAAVVRKDSIGWPENGYQVENALSREHALRGMTIWAARSNFEETEKGSLEVGKFADFIILDTDLLTQDEKQLLKARVLKTFINGEKVFEKK